jgi:L-ascorbate metabolism protein UlaG (beta-lactamase superfamily)
MTRLAFTWLGHATFLFRSPGGKRILTDPWVTTNPQTPDGAKKIDALDLILVTHGHGDHTEDLVSIARATGAPIVSTYEIALWLEAKGLQHTAPMGHGGTQTIGGVGISMVDAVHTNSIVENGQVIGMGRAAGYVLRFEDGLTVYFAGDTALFGDMRLIRELHHPAIAFLPIGDHFTMGPEAASVAADLLGVRQVVPMHYGTFPILTGTPAALRAHLAPKGIEVLELAPGETTE